MRVGALVCLCVVAAVLAACGGGGGGAYQGPAKGSYPAPRTRYDERTADWWFERAQDANHLVFENSVEALRSLGKEGVPYLIQLCDAYEKNPRRLSHSLRACQPQHIDDEDLPFFLQFLGDQFAATDNFEGVRFAALAVITQAGPRARSSCLASVRAHEGDSLFGIAARESARVIDGMDRQEAAKMRREETEAFRRKLIK